MGKSCRLTPVLFKKEGTKTIEVESKLFKDIKEAVQDQETAWDLWALTKTPEFREQYKNEEHDELGEIKFLPLIKILGIEDEYNRDKSIKAVSRDYGFTNTVIRDPGEAMRRVEEFNLKEKNYVAILTKTDNGYTVTVLPRNAANVQAAKKQSYNHALTGEIINLLRTLGFDVSFVSDPAFDGLFNPEESKLVDGLIQIIQIANGERGEEALPEEFSHLIIEGLISTPLVQRLLNTITSEQIEQVLGEQYEDYYKQYNGDALKLKKEVAGKLLADYIKNKGTLYAPVIEKKKSLLQRIWNFVKNLFSKVTRNDLYTAQERAYEQIADIYNMVSSGEIQNVIETSSILKGEQLFKLSDDYKTAEAIANKGLSVNAKMLQMERSKSKSGKLDKQSAVAHGNIRSYHEKGDVDSQLTSLMYFLEDTSRRLIQMKERMTELAKKEKEGTLIGMEKMREIARCNRDVYEIKDGYEEILDLLTTMDEDENIQELKIDKKAGQELAKRASDCKNMITSLYKDAVATSENILISCCRTVYGEDRVRGIGSKRNEVMSLVEILKHADKDINFVDRWITALSDASDPLLSIFDSIVKNQQYDRDMEMSEWNAQIAKLDKELRDAGYDPSFIYEMKDGVPTGRLLSIYDWDTYNKELAAEQERLRKLQEENNWSENKYREMLSNWKNAVNSEGEQRLITVYVDPKVDADYRAKKPIPADAVKEIMPNPKWYSNKANTIENLSQAQKDYYNRAMEIKRIMMTKIPHRGQYIYRAPYISKDFIDGILENKTGNIWKSTLEQFRKKFVRRPDEIGFGATEQFPQDVLEILKKKDIEPIDAATEIIRTLDAATDEDVFAVLRERDIAKIIKKNKDDIETAQKEILDYIISKNFYVVETDFADHRIQRLPIYYTRPLRDMKMLSTDFSGVLTAYSAMAVNYEKMNEVVDILEVGRSYIRDQRKYRISTSKGSMYSKTKVFGKIYEAYVNLAGSETNILGRLDDYMASVIYEERKKDEGTVELLGINLDVAKTLDAVKDYTGLLGLGMNVFSSISNVAVGKIQQWIEASGGEYFTWKDYIKACYEYDKLIWGHLAEINNPIKKNKLTLLIQTFDPMGDYFEGLRNAHHSKHLVAKVLGNGALGYIGMNAGEHMLHCQNMLAVLYNIKLIEKGSDGSKKEISLYDALEVQTGEDGISRLILKEGLSYERDLIDNTGDPKTNKNYGKPLLDENGKIKTEEVPIGNKDYFLKYTKNAINKKEDEDDDTKQQKEVLYDNFRKFIRRKKRIIRGVNDSLNGAFGVNDKGAAHRYAILRMVAQFRQWMPAHYERRFARAHYDSGMEQWREGYYITVAKTMNQIAKDIKRGRFELAKTFNRLNRHEKANLRRAFSEVSIYFTLATLVRLGGRVKDRDRNWLNKMTLYQLNRMKLEVGASMPLKPLTMLSNLIQLLQSPTPTINTLEKFEKALNFHHALDEIETGRYRGWTELERDVFNLTPYLPQFYKAYDFDDSMFSMFED